MKYQYSIITLRPTDKGRLAYITIRFMRPSPARIVRVWFKNAGVYRLLSARDYDCLAELLRISPELIYSNVIRGTDDGGDGKRYGSCLTISDTGTEN